MFEGLILDRAIRCVTMAVRGREYTECQECGFVLQSAGTDPRPRHWDACPDCGADDFAFLER